VSVINAAVNAIVRVHLALYIWVILRFCGLKKLYAGMANAAIFQKVLLALRHRHMASLTLPAVSYALVVGLATGCASVPTHTSPGDSGPSGAPQAPLPATTVTSYDIDRAGTDDPIETALAAHVPGVMVTRTPDGGIAVRIRGNSSISSNMEPLYVIDGVAIQPGPGGALLGINPRDIATIEVLKDAASLSFYGLRSGNGVILIKTKHATAN
jgi:TonB-dependent SusC/RagA subfamily outer membrane receptor